MKRYHPRNETQRAAATILQALGVTTAPQPKRPAPERPPEARPTFSPNITQLTAEQTYALILDSQQTLAEDKFSCTPQWVRATMRLIRNKKQSGYDCADGGRIIFNREWYLSE